MVNRRLCMIEKLRKITKILLKNKTITVDYRKRLELINKLLDDDTCFFKIDIETAYNIIRDLGFTEEESFDIYKKLISSKNF